jgi:drug/metabolite transporter (DMT)-like permease
MLKRYEWMCLLLGGLVCVAIAVLVAKDDTLRGFFWGLGAALAFGAVIAWLDARESNQSK